MPDYAGVSVMQVGVPDYTGVSAIQVECLIIREFYRSILFIMGEGGVPC